MVVITTTIVNVVVEDLTVKKVVKHTEHLETPQRNTWTVTHVLGKMLDFMGGGVIKNHYKLTCNFLFYYCSLLLNNSTT